MATISENSGSNVEIEKRLGRIEQQLEGVAAMAALQPNGPFGYQAQPGTDEIDLRKLWNVVWRGKWVIIALAFVFAVASVLYALSLPNIYRSEAMLAPANENSGGGLAGLAGQFGGLASLAGVNLGSGGSDKTTLALEVLKSREFISKFIQKHDLLVPLMAAEGWNRNEDELLIDSDIYDTVHGRWVRESKPPRLSQPSLQESYKEFVKRLSVTQDKTSSFVKISVEYYSPKLSKQWVDNLVEDINLEIKARDVAEAKKSIHYLTGQLVKTSVADMKAVFYQLIEEQSKTVMFAEVRDEYVFKTIDRAVQAEENSRPKRGVIVVLMTILGFMLGLSLVVVLHVLRSGAGSASTVCAGNVSSL